MRIESDRCYLLAVNPAQAWEAMGQVDAYQGWWPWLHRFDGTVLAAGQRWRCVVQPPLPYRVSFTVLLNEVAEAARVAATIEGDILGAAHIELTPKGTGCELRFRSSLAPANPALQALAALARPVVTFGHNWVLDTGARQFAARMENTDHEA